MSPPPPPPSCVCRDLTQITFPELPRTLQTIKIYLPPKTELVPVPKAASYLGPFGTLISSSAPPVLQGPSAPAPRVVHHNRVSIPKGFNCGLCRPATDGSLVYLLARQKHQNMMTIGIYAFWVFVYDWKTRRGFQIRLPEVFFSAKYFTLFPLISRIIRGVAGVSLPDRDTLSSYKTGRI